MTTFPIPHAVERFLGLSAPSMLRLYGLTFHDVDAHNRMIVEATPEALRAVLQDALITHHNGSPWATLAKQQARRLLGTMEKP